MSDDAFEFYPCPVDGAPASIYVNLRYEMEAPPAGATTRYAVVIQLREAGDYGIGTADEGTALDAVEQALITRQPELVYVGRLRTRGVWEITFYGPDERTRALRTMADELAGGRRVDVLTERDRDWRYYRELLLPDAERRQWMDDRRMVEVLREQGDGLRSPRRVDHRLAFGSEAQRDAFVSRATSAGFTLERVAAADGAFHAHVFRDDAIELDHIHDVVMTLVDLAAPHEGRHVGWTAPITP